MTDTIEPGDLWRDYAGNPFVATNTNIGDPPPLFSLIAKGPGWTRHDGSATNPVPGAEVEGYTSGGLWSPRENPTTGWRAVQFYRVTREAPSQPPAPQPGWVATVTIERTDQLTNGQPRVKFPGHWHVGIPRSLFDALVWSPPPPPPWEPAVGERAWYVYGDQHVTITALSKTWAIVTYDNGREAALGIELLTPPKGGEA